MSNIVILYENFADSGIFRSDFGSWLSALPLTDMVDPDIQVLARSTDAGATSTRFRIDLGTVKPVDGVAFGPTNMSPGSTWRVRAFSDTNFYFEVYDSGLQQVSGEVIDWGDVDAWLEWEDPGFWLGISEENQLSELTQFLYHIVPTDMLNNAFAQYWQFEFFDSANADGNLSIGRLLISRAFRPELNYSGDNSLSVIPLVDMEESRGGLRTYFDRGQRRSFRCAFPLLTEDEAFGEAFRMMLRSSISKQVFIVPDPADTTFGTRRSFLATLKQIPPIQQLLFERASVAFDLEEVL